MDGNLQDFGDGSILFKATPLSDFRSDDIGTLCRFRVVWEVDRDTYIASEMGMYHTLEEAIEAAKQWPDNCRFVVVEKHVPGEGFVPVQSEVR